MSLFGKGIYDSSIKKLKIRSLADASGVREISAEWDKKRRCLQFRLPPLRWLWGEDGENLAVERLEEIMKDPMQVELTFNNQDWVPGPDFEYHDHSLARLRLAHEEMEEKAEDAVPWEDEIPEEEEP